MQFSVAARLECDHSDARCVGFRPCVTVLLGISGHNMFHLVGLHLRDYVEIRDMLDTLLLPNHVPYLAAETLKQCITDRLGSSNQIQLFIKKQI